MTSSPDPLATPDQVTSLGDVRVTVLTDRLLRIEYASDGRFEDRPTLAVVNRRFPAPRFRTEVDGSSLTIDTGAVRLTCSDVGRPFSPRTLKATIRRGRDGSATSSWHFGKAARTNLGGTVRTLDGWKGRTTARVTGFDPDTGFVREWDEQPLGPGLLSRDGWVLVDDGGSVVLDSVPGPGTRSRRWPVPRDPGERQDLYLFAYGTDHRAALAAGAQLFGHQPLPPRHAFGYWYSRYYPYTDHELVELADQLDRNEIPVDVLVIDMDWHRLGWTGYSWDRDLFPDPTATLGELHRRGLRITLNLHPAEGVGRHEDAFEDMCEAMGLDPATTERIPFDIGDPRFVDAYFRLLHHPEEDRGVDFWWMDWQQGTESQIPGLDPLAWLNHLHWDDQARRRPQRRPLIFSRWGGLGAGRYPVGFSGDTHAVWESLDFQAEFTASAANVGFGYWSHDIGGHFGTTTDPELYARWIQFGIHSPVLRTHSTLGPEMERRVWEMTDPYRSVMVDAIRHRYEMVPYLYGECRSGVDTGLSLVRPMYHHHPETKAAYEASGQFHLGDHVVVAPVTSPLDDDAMAGVRVWLPQGEWFDVAHGTTLRVDGERGRWFDRRYLLDEVPVFVPAGTVLPGQRDVRRLDAPCYPNLVITAYPGERGRYDLYEDDGTSTGYLRDRSVTVPLSQRSTARRRTVTLEPATGSYRSWERRRPAEVRFVAEAPPRTVQVDGVEVPFSTADGRARSAAGGFEVPSSSADAHRRTPGGGVEASSPPATAGAGSQTADRSRSQPVPGRCWWYDAAEATVVVSIPRVDLRRGTTVSVERVSAHRREAAEASIDGYPGLARRLKMADEATRTLLGDDNRRIVALTQAVARIERDPSCLITALTAVREGFPALDGILEAHADHWRQIESVNPLDPPIASTTIETARRTLATARAQFLP